MPILLCPNCGENDLVSLARCQAFIEGLPILTASGPGAAVVPIHCARCCEAREASRQPLAGRHCAGATATLKRPIPRLLAQPECRAEIPAGNVVTVVDVVACADDGVVYIVRTSSGFETIAVPDWVE